MVYNRKTSVLKLSDYLNLLVENLSVKTQQYQIEKGDDPKGCIFTERSDRIYGKGYGNRTESVFATLDVALRSVFTERMDIVYERIERKYGIRTSQNWKIVQNQCLQRLASLSLKDGI